jgi:hypothetical protein
LLREGYAALTRPYNNITVILRIAELYPAILRMGKFERKMSKP